MRKKQIIQVLAKQTAEALERENLDFEKLQEIRIRVGKPLAVLYKGEEIFLRDNRQRRYLVTKDEIRETLDYVSGYSLYAYENELRRGFITIEGGHRVGMTGQTIIEKEKIKNLKHISSVNIRVSHEVKGCAAGVMRHISHNGQICHTLIISPPGCGKTTLLRDIIRHASDGCQYVKGCTVGVVDERSEIGGCYMGVAQNDLGIRTDILDCCPKAEGMLMLIRSMAPRILAVDEIGAEEDVRAVEYAIHCGCKLLVTAHGASVEEIRKKPLFEQMIREKRFERYVVLSSRHHVGGIEGIYDNGGNLIYKETVS